MQKVRSRAGVVQQHKIGKESFALSKCIPSEHQLIALLKDTGQEETSNSFHLQKRLFKGSFNRNPTLRQTPRVDMLIKPVWQSLFNNDMPHRATLKGADVGRDYNGGRDTQEERCIN